MLCCRWNLDPTTSWQKMEPSGEQGRCLHYSSGRLLDLEPPPACTVDETCNASASWYCRGMPTDRPASNVLSFSELLEQRWTHARLVTADELALSKRPVRMREVAVGMPVAGKWVARLPGDPDGSAATANAQCHNGEPLACAVATWMAMAPQLDTLLLADCGPLRGRLVLPRWDNEGGDEKGTGSIE